MKDAIVIFTREELKDFVERVSDLNEFELRCEIEHLFTYEQGFEPADYKPQPQYCAVCQREIDLQNMALAYGVPVADLRSFVEGVQP